MASNPVAWFEIYVDDMARAKQFYETVFQVTLEFLNDPTGSGVEMFFFPSNMEQYGATGALVKMAEVSAGGGGTMVYFECHDCAVESARVEAAGGSMEMEKVAIGKFGFCSIAVDSEGNRIGLHSEQ